MHCPFKKVYHPYLSLSFSRNPYLSQHQLPVFHFLWNSHISPNKLLSRSSTSNQGKGNQHRQRYERRAIWANISWDSHLFKTHTWGRTPCDQMARFNWKFCVCQHPLHKLTMDHSGPKQGWMARFGRWLCAVVYLATQENELIYYVFFLKAGKKGPQQALWGPFVANALRWVCAVGIFAVHGSLARMCLHFGCTF